VLVAILSHKPAKLIPGTSTAHGVFGDPGCRSRLPVVCTDRTDMTERARRAFQNRDSSQLNRAKEGQSACEGCPTACVMPFGIPLARTKLGNGNLL